MLSFQPNFMISVTTLHDRFTLSPQEALKRPSRVGITTPESSVIAYRIEDGPIWHSEACSTGTVGWDGLKFAPKYVGSTASYQLGIS